MVEQMDAEGFGACTVTGTCEAVCPKEISLDFIARMNRDYGVALLEGRTEASRRRRGLIFRDISKVGASAKCPTPTMLHA